ncbi:MAG: subclass B1 metallo-beta-lactamase [Chitinophagales bacterium]|nr:subclass B1 metallo-beta-lactamase [Chitinophagales bacterium]
MALPVSCQYSIKITPVDSNIYLYTSYGDAGNYKNVDANAVVLISGNDAILFDTPWDDAQAAELISFVQDSLGKHILMAIITHAHVDRIGSINTMHKNNIPTLCYQLTAEEAPKHGHSVPKHIFYSVDTIIKCGNIEVEAFYPGSGHTIDNIVLYIPSKQFLYGGCFIKSGFSSSIGNIEDADMAAWPISVNRMNKHFSKTGIKTVIPGHGSWMSDKAIENTIRLLEEEPAKRY